MQVIVVTSCLNLMVYVFFMVIVYVGLLSYVQNIHCYIFINPSLAVALNLEHVVVSFICIRNQKNNKLASK